MTTYSLRDTLVVYQGDSMKLKTDSSSRNHFEILFVERGIGDLFFNDRKLSYDTEDILIVTTKDTYRFVPKKHSKISFFCFTDLLLSNKTNFSERKYWMQRIEQIMNHPYKPEGDLISFEEDRKIMWDLHHLAIEELKNERRYYQEIVSNAISTMLSMIVRNLSKGQEYKSVGNSVKDNKINQVLSHIHQNVYNNDLTKISYLADRFGMSQSSLSITFKKTTGDSIHQYVTKFKMKLAEERLQNTEFTVAQIASQLGYTDESHLTKTFKKYFAMSPKQYRQEITLEN